FFGPGRVPRRAPRRRVRFAAFRLPCVLSNLSKLLLGRGCRRFSRRLAGADRLAPSPSRAGVRLRPLPADGEIAAVAHAAPAADLDVAVDVLLDLAAQLALHSILLLQKRVDETDLVLGQVLHPSAR